MTTRAISSGVVGRRYRVLPCEVLAVVVNTSESGSPPT